MSDQQWHYVPTDDLFNPFKFATLLTSAVAEAQKASAEGIVIWTHVDDVSGSVSLPIDEHGLPDLSRLKVVEGLGGKASGVAAMLKALLLCVLNQILPQLPKKDEGSK